MILYITGANGFVGRNMLNYFSAIREATVIPVGRQPGQLSYEQFLADPRRVGCLIHLAGKAHDLRRKVDYSEYEQANVLLTGLLFDHFSRSSLQKFIFFSSVKAVADTALPFLDESTVPAPKTAYGLSKLAAEDLLISAELPPDKSVHILRPAMIHGPGNKGNMNLLFRLARTGAPLPLEGFANQRSLLSVQNVNYVVRRIATEPVPPGIYHVADDEPLSTVDIFKTLAEATGQQGRTLAVPPKAIRGLARLGDYVPGSPLTSERLMKLTETYTVSNAKLKKVLKIERLPLSVREGLRINAAAMTSS